MIVPGRLTSKISCENFLNLLSYECLTQFYLTNQHVNWINRNLKFICSSFEVCIKISKSSQVWTTDLEGICICFQHINLGLWLLRMTLLVYHKGTGRWCKKVCLAFSLVHISFPKNLVYLAHAEFWFFNQIFFSFEYS